MGTVPLSCESPSPDELEIFPVAKNAFSGDSIFPLLFNAQFISPVIVIELP